MIFDTDVMIWAFRGNGKALDAIDEATTRSISSVTYMELLQGVRNKAEMLLKSDLGVCDALIFATALESGDTLLSGNAKHFKEVPLLDARAFRA